MNKPTMIDISQARVDHKIGENKTFWQKIKGIKIKGIAKKIFSALSRYFGAIHSHEIRKRINTVESKNFFPHILACNAGHTMEPYWLNETKLSFKDHYYFDPKTGLKATLVQNGDKVIIAFGTKTCANAELEDKSEQKKVLKKQDLAIYQNLLGAKPKVYRQAAELYDRIIRDNKLNKDKVTLTGKCFGGSIAEYVSLKKKVHSVCFNTLPIGTGLQQELGKKTLKEADKYVDHLIVEKDWASDFTFFKVAGKIFRFMQIRTPRNFGCRYTIPSAYSISATRHIHVLGSMMAYQGYDRWTEVPQYLFVEEMLKKYQNLSEQLRLPTEYLAKMAVSIGSPFLKISKPTPYHRMVHEIGKGSFSKYVSKLNKQDIEQLYTIAKKIRDEISEKFQGEVGQLDNLIVEINDILTIS